jgi:hypothetical protein
MKNAMTERYLRFKPIVQRAAVDPVEGWLAMRAHFAERGDWSKPHFHQSPYVVTDAWERRLHEVLGVPWPCADAVEFWNVWPRVLAPFREAGVRIGRGAFDGWGDGEPGLARAAWCLVHHLRPVNVVETGVARGMTSRIILEALERNGAGRLWSIDLPPLRPEMQAQIGAAVGSGLRHRWTYIKGSSRRRLPALLRKTGEIDLFIHDSAHSEYNVRFELDRAWAALKPGGAVMADDIDYNWGFRTFSQAHPGHQFLICPGEPLEPDPIRFDAKGLFGIARKVA